MNTIKILALKHIELYINLILFMLNN